MQTIIYKNLQRIVLTWLWVIWLYILKPVIKDIYSCLTDKPPLIENKSTNKKNHSLIIISDIGSENSVAFDDINIFWNNQLSWEINVETYHINSTKDLLYLLNYYCDNERYIDQLILCAHGLKGEISWSIDIAVWSRYFDTLHKGNISKLLLPYKWKIRHIVLDVCYWWRLADEIHVATWASVVWPLYSSILWKRLDGSVSQDTLFVWPILQPKNNEFILVNFNWDTTVVQKSVYEELISSYKKDAEATDRLQKNTHTIESNDIPKFNIVLDSFYTTAPQQ